MAAVRLSSLKRCKHSSTEEREMTVRGNYPLTRARLHSVLLELLNHPEVSLSFGLMTAQQGLSNWNCILPPTNIVIKVDANQQTGAMDHIGTVVHELLHVVFINMFIGWLTEDMEEIAILAYDADMLAYIRKSPKRLHTWEEAINRKLHETEAKHEASG
jgi:hypothetical protein